MWRGSLDARGRRVLIIYPPVPALSAEQTGWGKRAFGAKRGYAVPSAVEVARNAERDANYRAPWDAPFRDPGKDGLNFVPGGLGRCSPYWANTVLQGNSQRDEILGWLRGGVSARDY